MFRASIVRCNKKEVVRTFYDETAMKTNGNGKTKTGRLLSLLLFYSSTILQKCPLMEVQMRRKACVLPELIGMCTF